MGLKCEEVGERVLVAAQQQQNAAQHPPDRLVGRRERPRAGEVRHRGRVAAQAQQGLRKVDARREMIGIARERGLEGLLRLRMLATQELQMAACVERLGPVAAQRSRLRERTQRGVGRAMPRFQHAEVVPCAGMARRERQRFAQPRKGVLVASGVRVGIGLRDQCGKARLGH